MQPKDGESTGGDRSREGREGGGAAPPNSGPQTERERQTETKSETAGREAISHENAVGTHRTTAKHTKQQTAREQGTVARVLC